MGYRGEDLDLRTPQTWNASPSDLAGASDPAALKNGQRIPTRSGPIWVDDTVLDSANHAYDVALAHRSAEVRLEHFLHALTRIDAAAEALEARGVRVAALRRESATIIASEIPVGPPNGAGTPHRSDDLADVLRLAAGHAARRNGPASVDDVLNVLFDPRADLPGLAILARHTLRSGSRETLEQFPPLSRFATEQPRYAPSSDRYVRVTTPEPARYMTETSRYRTDYAGTPIDAVQNTRIEALEQMVRNLSSDLASERQVVSSMLKELSRDTQAHRDDQGRMHTGLYERMQMLEQAMTDNRGGTASDGLAGQLLNLEVTLEQRLKELSHDWSTFSTRLQDLETSLRMSDADISGAKAIDLEPVSARLEAIEKVLGSRGGGDVADRLKSLEGEIAKALAANTASTGRMETLISGFEKQKPDFAAPIVERLSAVERALAAEIETAAAKHQAYANDLGEVHDALLKLNQNQHTLAGSIDQWRTDAAGDIAMISNRLTALDRDNERPMEAMNKLSAHMETINRTMIERYHRRHRFMYWLFGTDDWIGASWPSQTAAIAADAARQSEQENEPEKPVEKTADVISPTH